MYPAYQYRSSRPGNSQPEDALKSFFPMSIVMLQIINIPLQTRAKVFQLSFRFKIISRMVDVDLIPVLSEIEVIA